MKNKFKKFLLCLLAVSMMSTAGTIHAVNDEEANSDAVSAETEGDETPAEEEESKRRAYRPASSGASSPYR